MEEVRDEEDLKSKDVVLKKLGKWKKNVKIWYMKDEKKRRKMMEWEKD